MCLTDAVACSDISFLGAAYNFLFTKLLTYLLSALFSQLIFCSRHSKAGSTALCLANFPDCRSMTSLYRYDDLSVSTVSKYSRKMVLFIVIIFIGVRTRGLAGNPNVYSSTPQLFSAKVKFYSKLVLLESHDELLDELLDELVLCF